MVLNTLLATKMMKKFKTLCITLLKMNGYLKGFDETKYIFVVNDGELLKKYNKPGIKFVIVSKKWFDSEPVYNKKYVKTKVKYCEGQINTSFCDNGILQEAFHGISLPLILIASVFKMIKDNYPSVFLEEQ